MKSTLYIFFLFINVISFSQSYKIEGIVVDDKSNEPLFNVKIIEKNTQKVAYSDEKGKFELNIDNNKAEILLRYIGYQEIETSFILKNDTTISFSLIPELDIQELSEIDVRGKGRDANVTSTEMGKVRLDVKEIKKLPAFLGEVDVIKTLQLTPGVQSANEGTQGFYVRGGGPDQNLVLLDGAHVYNASHLFGFFSVFNVDAINNVELTKVGMPAHYGGRLSSVLDVNLNSGSKEKFGGAGGIGLISSRLTLEGPIVKDKASFIVSGRRTYLDVVTRPFIDQESGFAGTGYYFYDLNGKIDVRLSEKDKLTLSGYLGKDDFSLSSGSGSFSVDMPWGNAIIAAHWKRRISDKTLLTVRANLTDYHFQFLARQDEFDFGLSSGIRDVGGLVKLDHRINLRHKITAGVEYIHHKFTPVAVSASQGDTDFDVGEGQRLFGHETALFLSDRFEATDRLTIDFGLRYSFYQHVGPFNRFINDPVGVQDSVVSYQKGELITPYSFPEPRITARYLINKKSSIKAGLNYNAQYVHLANISAVALPTDIWYPATDLAPPQTGWQAAIGYFRNFFDNNYETSVELYYKQMNNLIEFKEGALPQDNAQENTDNLLTLGEGYSYGAELFIKKTTGKLTGWIGYTWSRTDRRFPEIFDGDWFPAKYDRRHDLSIVANYDFNDNWSVATNFVYATGNAITLPTSWYLHDGDVQFEFGPRNASRMPDYHRLDFSLNWQDSPTKTVYISGEDSPKEVKKRFRNSVNLSIYNVYSRQNPFFLFVQNEGSFAENNFNISLQQVALFPILPSITWNFEF